MLADNEQKLKLLQGRSSSSLDRTVTKTPLESRLVTSVYPFTLHNHLSFILL